MYYFILIPLYYLIQVANFTTFAKVWKNFYSEFFDIFWNKSFRDYQNNQKEN